MLNRNAAAHCLHAFQVAVRNGLAVVEKPVQSFEWNVAVHFLEDVQEAGDALIISRVQPEWPFVCSQQADDFLEFAFE